MIIWRLNRNTNYNGMQERARIPILKTAIWYRLFRASALDGVARITRPLFARKQVID